MTATRAPRTTSLLAVAKQNLLAEAQAGNEMKRWRGLGYAGFVSGGASYGVGPQGVIARLTGGSSAESWRTLYHWGAKCTRIDLQCTVRLDSDPAERIAQDWETVVKRWKELKRAHEPHLHCGPYGPETIEIGSRQSERFGRIYDKRKESKLDHYSKAVRWEVEFKGSVAGMVAKHLVDEGLAFTGIAPHVVGFFSKYRVSLPAVQNFSAHTCAPRRETDVTKKIRYLHTSIRPLVQFLISSGRVQEVYQALELPMPLYDGPDFKPDMDHQTSGGK